ncbi:ABC transporter substrate-binding protein [Bifidobacterium sp. ESL0732]|uniref:ABC transporter substrate-binding protein n=1 Tax=Bifidobacterium sp. ESL0732 TaxID=2983222 RepID=UPI0023F88B7F|nr:ABC transporter substrate-binding protein [Bifidobacterium sp. ESL0732]WEV64262.1 ABC transporter substrate-binding protein [Bifidobacterium sp. ESL0732]
MMSNTSKALKVFTGLAAIAMLTPLAACGSSNNSSSKGSGSVSIACSQQDDFCQMMSKQITKDTGIRAAYVRLGSGEILARLATNPGEFDAWIGGPVENHLIADSKGWLEHYVSPSTKNYQAKYKDAKGTWSGVYTDSLGFCSNSVELKKKGLKAPTSWNDLLNPKLEKSIGMPHPSTAGAGYDAIYTQAMLHGGDLEQAMDYFKKLSPNIMQYSKAAATGTEQAGRGEVTVAISLDSDCVKAKEAGYKDLVTSYPAEGAGYDVGGVSIMKQGHNKENAKKVVDWVLGPKFQTMYPDIPTYVSPTNPQVKAGKDAPDQSKVKHVKWNMQQSANSREKFIDAFAKEVSSSSNAK